MQTPVRIQRLQQLKGVAASPAVELKVTEFSIFTLLEHLEINLYAALPMFILSAFFKSKWHFQIDMMFHWNSSTHSWFQLRFHFQQTDDGDDG